MKVNATLIRERKVNTSVNQMRPGGLGSIILQIINVLDKYPVKTRVVLDKNNIQINIVREKFGYSYSIVKEDLFVSNSNHQLAANDLISEIRYDLKRIA